MSPVASYDVFDTVLTRLVGGPRQVFVATGRRLRQAGVVDVDAEAYAATREAAVHDLTRDVAHHPPLRCIAEDVAARLGLPGTVSDLLLTAELTVEREVCRAVPGAVARVARSRADTGRGVVFVSDTPLPREFVQELLAREGLFRDGDRLWTSAEAGASKQEGGLYDLVAAELGVAPAELVHVGDDRWADLVHARLHGWRASFDPRARLTPREERLDRAAVTTEGWGPRLAGAARMGRLWAEEERVDPALAGIAGGVALPLLAGFGLWVLRQARLLELDRLYFLARDGEVVLEVTRRLAEAAGHPVECRYLHGSRRAWQLASAGTRGSDPLRDLWVPDEEAVEDLSARAITRLMDLSPAEAYALTRAPEFAPDRADTPLGPEGWGRVRELLRGEPLAVEIRRRTRSRCELLVRYLDQEGVTAPGRVGLVDVGWTGRATRSLEDVLSDAGRPAPTAHLFVGLLGPASGVMGADLYARSRGWLIDEPRGRLRPPGDEDPVMLVESFAMGSEGSTLGYAMTHDRVVPELAAEQNPATLGWDFAGYRRALGHALAALLDGPTPDAGVDLRPLVWEQVLDLWRRPTREEAAVWGAQPYGEDFANARTSPLATPVTTRRMLTRLRVGPARWRRPTYWLAGTIALTPQPWRSLLQVAQRAQRLSARLPRVPRRLRGELELRRRVKC